MWAPADRIDQVDFALSYSKMAQDFLEVELAMEFQLPKLGKDEQCECDEMGISVGQDIYIW